MPGTDMPDTIHTPTDMDMDTDATITHTLILATDMLDIHTITEVIIMENRFSNVHKIPFMAKKAGVEDHQSTHRKSSFA